MNGLTTRRIAKAVAAIILTVMAGVAGGAIPTSINYQAFLADLSGAPLDSNVDVTFNLYTVETGGAPIWSETRTVAVAGGLLSVELGADPANLFPVGAFDTPLWLGLSVGADAEMTPRRQLGSTGYSFKAEDADALQGRSAFELDQSSHVTDTANPHAVSAGQAGAASSASFDAHARDESAHHAKTVSFAELAGQAADAQIPAGIARDAELDWGNLSGVPAGFADGTDDGLAGVTAGPGLVGGGTTGNVTLSLQAPLSLTGPHDVPLVTGVNQAAGYGVYGGSAQGSGVYGYSVNVSGVYGYSGSGIGVHGINGTIGNFGYLGTPQYGVYGSSSSGYAGYFEGNAMVTSDLLVGNAGNIGIGLTNPNRRLYVVEDVPGLGYALKLDNPHAGIGQTGVGILFSTEGLGSGALGPERGKGGLTYVSTGTWNRGAFHFLQDSGTDDETPDLDDAVMTIANDGDVGIGTTTPQAQLDVAGDLKVSGNISWPAKTSYYTVPASAFQPPYGTSQFQRREDLGYFNQGSSATSAYAPVNLPHGATVVRVTAFWYDSTSANGTLEMRRYDLDESYWGTMAQMPSYWDDPCCDTVRVSFDATIDAAVIDNYNHKYALRVSLPGGNEVKIRGVRIEYTTTGNG